jgi:hypothetical protein
VVKGHNMSDHPLPGSPACGQAASPSEEDIYGIGKQYIIISWISFRINSRGDWFREWRRARRSLSMKVECVLR